MEISEKCDVDTPFPSYILSYAFTIYSRTRYLELAYFELPLISKWKSSPCFNMKLWRQVTK